MKPHSAVHLDGPGSSSGMEHLLTKRSLILIYLKAARSQRHPTNSNLPHFRNCFTNLPGDQRQSTQRKIRNEIVCSMCIAQIAYGPGPRRKSLPIKPLSGHQSPFHMCSEVKADIPASLSRGNIIWPSSMLCFEDTETLERKCLLPV